MPTPVVDFSEAFGDCRTISQANALYRELFEEHDGTQPEVFMPLSEAHRKVMESLTVEAKIAAQPRDPNRVRPHELRNWCSLQGIVINKKGRVPMHIENQYREAHDMPPLETRAPAPAVDTTGLDLKAVRVWAREQGIKVGQRGRLHPDVVRQYVARAQGVSA